MASFRNIGILLGIAPLAAGCVQPVYQAPGPIPLLNYPPPVSYRSIPDYREPAPLALQPTPMPEPLPPAAAPATAAAPPDDLGGSIPVQDMPAPASLSSRPPADPADPADQSASAPPPVRKVPTAGTGTSVPLEGFRPMHSQTRPAP